MTELTNFYGDSDHQMQHCDECDMPAAVDASDETYAYSLVKHKIIEAREIRKDPSIEAVLRLKAEADGTLSTFEAAQRCMNCAEGLVLLIDGSTTGWRVGGEQT